jgi:hypothetical protein
MEEANPLVGTWELISWENRSPEGEVTYPLGEDAVGRIAYAADGFVFVALMRRHRPPFAATDLLSASPEEKAEAAAGYVSYCGRYEQRGSSVVHHVELSLFPNWIGLDQERLFELRGDRLTLSTRPMLLAGRIQTAHLVWRRM